MSIEDFILKQDPERQATLSEIHQIIIENDGSIKAEIKPMMGKEMIIYDAPGIFKYGLASMKDYMSLHVLPIYGSKELHAKYKELLPRANFQKGCINFKNEGELPLDIVKQLIKDCSVIDLLKIRNEELAKRKKKK